MKCCPRLNSVFLTKKIICTISAVNQLPVGKKNKSPEKEIFVMFSCIPVIHSIYYIVNML